MAVKFNFKGITIFSNKFMEKILSKNDFIYS